jgi:hypothetical protein
MSSSIEPLYQQLKKESRTTDLSSEQKDEFIHLVKLLDDIGNEIMYILIRLYETETATRTTEFPYGSKFTLKELKFDLDNIPIPLQWIIYSFSKKHVNKMSEEREFEKLQKRK